MGNWPREEATDITMKVKVNRLLSAGRYHVNFKVGDFTQDELSKMSSFGVPLIDLRWASASGMNTGRVPINQINKNQSAVFGSDSWPKNMRQEF